jgi:predicted amidohydrolase
MKVTVVSYSLSEQPRDLASWKAQLKQEILELSVTSRIILYPELNLMGLTDYFPGELKLQYQLISDFIQQELLPELTQLLKGKDLLLCLGSGPRKVDESIFNSAFIWLKDTWIYQDKIHLTPWEVDFTSGNEVKIFDFHGLKSCALICFDIEQPGLSLYLKRQETDLILVPSATTNQNGNQRVNRCASARAIELGAVVITSPLVGDSKCDLIDHSEGRAGFFLPAQEVVNVPQELFSDYSTGKKIISHFDVEVAMVKDWKKKDGETKPYFKDDLILP